MSTGTRSNSKSPTPAGGSRRMHGFSVAIPDEGGERGQGQAGLADAMGKRPREASLPMPPAPAMVPTAAPSLGDIGSYDDGTMHVTLPGDGDQMSYGGAARDGAKYRHHEDNEEEDEEEEEEEESEEDDEESGEESPTQVMKPPNTPLGKVVAPGQEHTGRWTKEEHDAFLVGLQLYGKEWKKVAAKVKTRTVVQTRTHAQKYFQKLQKAMKSSDDKGRGGRRGSVEMGTVGEAKKATPTGGQKLRSSTTKSPARRTASTEAAAQLVTRMSSASQPSSASPPPDRYKQYADGSFSSQDTYYASEGYGGGAIGSFSESMKITAPAHDVAIKQGKFPEPSPAACGKRKLAEIAAAQMLAGVMTSGGPKANSSDTTLSNAMLPQFPDRKGGRIIDGSATPPVAHDVSVSHLSQNAGNGASGGLSLQIVNPDALDEGPGKRKKLLQGMPSPMTPWDGQLQALVSEVTVKDGDKEGDESEFPGLPNLHADEKVMEFSVSEPTKAIVPSDDLPSRSHLHRAVCSGLTNRVSEIIEKLGKVDATKLVNQRDELGFFPLHSAASLCLPEVDSFGFQQASKIARVLLSSGADVACCDLEGSTPLHWASRVGNDELTQLFLMNRSPIDAQNNDGETPLHWALRSGAQGMSTARLLLQSGSKISTLNREFQRPIDVAARGFKDKSIKARTLGPEEANERREARANFLSNSPQSRTLILHHPDCLDHIPKSSMDWEAPDRVKSIMERISYHGAQSASSALRPYEITVSSDFDRAPLELLSRVHSAEYLQFVNDLSKDLESKRKQQIIQENQEARDAASSVACGNAGKSGEDNHHVVPFTPMVQRSVMRESQVKEGGHSDTSFSAGSLKAARRAAGAVQHAVDRVLVGRNRNAFCAVRPPGHHAGVNGLLAGGESCGFCIFNSVAAGAMHALSDESHRPRCDRVAIVDIDAHHGNGTEEIIKKCHDPQRLFFFSVHIFDHDRKKGGVSTGYKFYPGTGDEDDVAHNIINVPLAPLWREKEVIGGLSNNTASKSPNAEPIQTRGRTRRRGSATDVSEKTSPEPNGFSSSDWETKSVGDGSATAKTGQITRPANYLLGIGRMAYRRAIQQRLLPSLRAFNPDLILISSGFDASRGDVGNARHYIGGKQSMGIDLEAEDYAWTTQKILEVADICCQGRVVSVLEGGYGRTPVQSVAAGGDHGTSDSLRLDKSLFAECAFRHIQALADPFDDEKRY